MIEIKCKYCGSCQSTNSDPLCNDGGEYFHKSCKALWDTKNGLKKKYPNIPEDYIERALNEGQEEIFDFLWVAVNVTDDNEIYLHGFVSKEDLIESIKERESEQEGSWRLEEILYKQKPVQFRINHIIEVEIKE